MSRASTTAVLGCPPAVWSTGLVGAFLKTKYPPAPRPRAKMIDNTNFMFFHRHPAGRQVSLGVFPRSRLVEILRASMAKTRQLPLQTLRRRVSVYASDGSGTPLIQK